MNAPLRRVAAAVLLLFGALLLNVQYLHVVKAEDLDNRPGNTRVLLREYEHERGQIVAGSTTLARSDETTGRLKYLRRYPLGPAFAHLTGYYSVVYGASGIEAVEDDLLSGEDDRLFVRRLSDLITGRTPQGGAVVLTIDPRAQQAAYDALGSRRGAVVALDPRTGAVLAAVSRPTFDPNALSAHDTQRTTRAYRQYRDDPALPLFNRALQGRYPPGSLFKVVTAAAALSSGRYRPTTVIPAPRTLRLPTVTAPLRNFGGEACTASGKQTLADALRISCNTAFAGLGMRLGADTLREQAERFGVGESLRIPLAVTPSVFSERELDRPATAQSAIGQRDVQLTPLQAAMVAAGVANRGSVMRPYLVKELRAPDLSVLETTRPERLSQAISATTAAQLTQMMVGVVDRGTASAARVPGVKVAGKTGTAQHTTGASPHAWFLCFAPADDPVVAVAVVIEDGGSSGSEATGGREAAPVARAVLRSVLGR